LYTAATVLSILLALLMVATGVPKVLNSATARKNAAHLAISTALSRLIGVAEVAAAIGLTAGMFIRPMATVTAAAVVFLMVGAAIYHRRARDPATAMAPAVITAAAAAAVVVLSTTD
jgi:uncharacterized membrane protein YphA (DoxX/SURF4 family)